MAQLRIAMAQVNATVGDLDGNAALIGDWTRRAHEAGAHVVVFPEMVLTGYPVEDLALRESFADGSKQALATLAVQLDEAAAATSRASSATSTGTRSGPRDAVAVLHGGEVVATQFKHHLPNYGVFDEQRYFKPGRTLDILRIHGLEVGMVDLRGHLAGGRPDLRARRGRRRPRRRAERLALRARQGRRAAAAGPAPRGRGRRAAGVRQPGRRAGRPGLRRRLDGRRRGRGAADPAAAVRRASHRARPGPAGRRGAHRGHGRRVHRDPADAVARRRCPPTSRSPPRRRAEPLPELAEVWARARARTARLRAQERVRARSCSGCPAGSTPRSARPWPWTRSARRTCTASRCRRCTPRSTRAPTRRTWPSGPGCTTRCSRSRTWSRRSPPSSG